MKIEIIYEDENLLAVDKPPGVVIYSEKSHSRPTLMEYLTGRFSFLEKTGKAPRFGVIHRLDKDTSGILLIAKTEEALTFFQQQFKERKVVKEYKALVIGRIKEKRGKIETLIGRAPNDRTRQKVFFPFAPDSKGKRKAITEYRVESIFKQRLDSSQAKALGKNQNRSYYYTLVRVRPKTGRKHQIRAHFRYLKHPLAGDKVYGFKNQISPFRLERQFLHANYLKIQLPNKNKKEFRSPLSIDLKKVLENLVLIE